MKIEKIDAISYKNNEAKEVKEDQGNIRRLGLSIHKKGENIAHSYEHHHGVVKNFLKLTGYHSLIGLNMIMNLNKSIVLLIKKIFINNY